MKYQSPNLLLAQTDQAEGTFAAWEAFVSASDFCQMFVLRGETRLFFSLNQRKQEKLFPVKGATPHASRLCFSHRIYNGNTEHCI